MREEKEKLLNYCMESGERDRVGVRKSVDSSRATCLRSQSFPEIIDELVRQSELSILNVF